MDYFELFNKVVVNDIRLTDITNTILLKSDVNDKVISYTFKDGDTIFDAAFELYGDDNLYWIIYLTNMELFYDPLKNTDEVSIEIEEKYNRTCYVLENDEFFKDVYSDYEILHRTDDGDEPILKYDSVRMIVVCDSDKTGQCIIKYDDNTVIPNQTEYNMRDAPKWYMFNELKYERKPSLYDSIITFEEDYVEENERKRTINVINPKYRDDLIGIIKERIN